MIKKGNLLILAVAALLFGFSLSGLPLVKSVALAAQDESVSALLGKGEKITNYSFDYTMDQTMGGQNVQMSGKTFISGKKTRNESTINGQKIIVITDTEAKVMYSYNPADNSAMKIPLNENNEANSTSKYNDKAYAPKMKVIGTETFDGIRCKVVSVEGEQGETTKMWLREDYGLPMKIETAMSEGKITMVYKNMKFDPLPAGLFVLPSGAKVTDMSEMMKNVPPKK